MLITDLREAEKRAKARSQPGLIFTSFAIHQRLKDIRAQFFPELPHQINLYFVNRGSLACVCNSEASATIYIHQVLNHAETPFEVFDMICKHELLHLRFPTKDVDEKRIKHPPEFWEAEREVCPERNLAWSWIWLNLGSCLRHRPRLERTDVLPAWKSVWCAPRINIAKCEELCICSDIGSKNRAESKLSISAESLF